MREAPSPRTAGESSIPWRLWGGGIWFVGSLTWLLVLLTRVMRFHCAIQRAPSAPEELQIRVRALAKAFGIASPPVVRLAPGILPPILWALGRSSTILIPERLLFRLSSDGIDTLRAHELAHLRRLAARCQAPPPGRHVLGTANMIRAR